MTRRYRTIDGVSTEIFRFRVDIWSRRTTTTGTHWQRVLTAPTPQEAKEEIAEELRLREQILGDFEWQILGVTLLEEKTIIAP